VHPIERLRFVARSTNAPQELLVAEAASALASFGSEPRGLLNACRRIVAGQPGAGALVSLCSHVLTSVDPADEARRFAATVATDTVAEVLDAELAMTASDGPPVLLEAEASGPDEALIRELWLDDARSARSAGCAVWLVVPAGRALPEAMYSRARTMATDAGARLGPWSVDDVDRIVDGDGAAGAGRLAERCRGPVAVELFRGIVV
jgi:hypothetical protein